MGIDQPGAPLALRSRGIRRLGKGQRGPGGFHKAPVATGRAAARAQQTSYRYPLAAVGHHGAAIPSRQRIGTHRAGPIHRGGGGIGNGGVGAMETSPHQYRAATGRATGIKGGALEGHPFAGDLDAAALARGAACRCDTA